MFRPEGLYEIVRITNDRPEESNKRIGRVVAFPFRVEVGSRAAWMYAKMGNSGESAGKFLHTSAVQAIHKGEEKDVYGDPLKFEIETHNSVYSFEKRGW